MTEEEMAWLMYWLGYLSGYLEEEVRLRYFKRHEWSVLRKLAAMPIQPAPRDEQKGKV